MDAITLAIALFTAVDSFEPNPFVPETFPPAYIGKATLEQCRKDVAEIEAQVEYIKEHSAWRVDDALTVLAEARRLVTIWDYVYYLVATDPHYYAHIDFTRESYGSCERWAMELRDIVGDRDFYAGRFPLPFSWR